MQSPPQQFGLKAPLHHFNIKSSGSSSGVKRVSPRGLNTFERRLKELSTMVCKFCNRKGESRVAVVLSIDVAGFELLLFSPVFDA